MPAPLFSKSQYYLIRRAMIRDYLDNNLTIQAIANKNSCSYGVAHRMLNSLGKITTRRTK